MGAVVKFKSISRRDDLRYDALNQLKILKQAIDRDQIDGIALIAARKDGSVCANFKIIGEKCLHILSGLCILEQELLSMIEKK